MGEGAFVGSFETIKPALREYLNDQVLAYRDHPEQGPEIAYRIAGLMANDALRDTPPDDPYVQILELAGQLGLPIAHQTEGSSWDALIAMVDAL